MTDDVEIPSAVDSQLAAFPLRRRLLEALCLTIFFFGVVGLVKPSGNFPLNDDWNFALATWFFERTGEFRFTRLTGMSLRLQVLWGALWTRAFGVSYETLRYSTLTLSLLTTLMANRLLIRHQIRPTVRFLVILSLLFHPIFFWSSFTYMTHVPFVFLSLASVHFFLRAFDEDRWIWAAVAAAAVIGSYFVRQTGVVNAVPPLVMLLMDRRAAGARRWIGLFALAAIGLFTVLFLFTDLLSGNPVQNRQHLSMMWSQPLTTPFTILRSWIHYVLFNFQYAGIFFLPLTLPLALFFYRRRTLSTGILVGLSAVFLARCGWLGVNGYLLPYWAPAYFSDIFAGNVLVNFGLGPHTLPDIWRHQMTYPFSLGWFPRFILSVGAALLGAVTLYTVVQIRKLSAGLDPRRARLMLYCAVLCIAGTVALLPSGYYFDRYALDSLWPFAIISAALMDALPVRRSLAAGVLVFLALFSTASTAEYLSWNRARWRAFAFLRQQSVPLTKMDGGYEINEYLTAGVPSIALDREVRGKQGTDCLITFNRIDGYEVLCRFPFQRFFGLSEESVLVLRRMSSSATPKARGNRASPGNPIRKPPVI